MDEQNGFRKDRSCVDHVFTLNNLLQNRTFATFVDLKKAFHFVDRNLLQHKLQLNAINECMYNAIASLYTDTESRVSINGYRVRQGDNLSPTLFSIFMNDLATELKELNKGVQMNSEKICLLL